MILAAIQILLKTVSQRKGLISRNWKECSGSKCRKTRIKSALSGLNRGWIVMNVIARNYKTNRIKGLGMRLMVLLFPKIEYQI